MRQRDSGTVVPELVLTDWPTVAGQMRQIPIDADVLHEFQTRLGKAYGLIDGPWLRIQLRIIDRDLKIHVTIVFAVEALDHASRFAHGTTQLIHPGFSVETLGLYN